MVAFHSGQPSALAASLVALASNIEQGYAIRLPLHMAAKIVKEIYVKL